MAMHCPARLFLAQHGETEYESDLITDGGGSLTLRGRQQARELADHLLGERIARVWCSPLSHAVQTAEIAAAQLGVGVVVRHGLREYGVGALADTDVDEVARVRDVLGEIADEHPGEAVLVISHGGVLQATVPPLVGLSRGQTAGRVLPHCGVIEVEKDADGWRLVTCDAN